MSKVSDFKKVLSQYEYFDIHAHVNSDPLLSQSELLVQICDNAGVMFNNAGSNLIDSLEGIHQAKAYKNVFAMIGIHPMCIDKTRDIVEYRNELEKIYLENKDYVLCIGEIGLEKVDDPELMDRQKQLLIELFDLARKYELPIELHIREAHDLAIELIKKHGQKLKLLIHCFALNNDYAKKYLDLGCWLSVNGIITFEKKNDDVLNALPSIPHNRLLIETDSPYLTPVPFRGKTNSPKNVILVFNKLKEIWKISDQELKTQLKSNALDFFTK